MFSTRYDACFSPTEFPENRLNGKDVNERQQTSKDEYAEDRRNMLTNILGNGNSCDNNGSSSHQQCKRFEMCCFFMLLCRTFIGFSLSRFIGLSVMCVYGGTQCVVLFLCVCLMHSQYNARLTLALFLLSCNK